MLFLAATGDGVTSRLNQWLADLKHAFGTSGTGVVAILVGIGLAAILVLLLVQRLLARRALKVAQVGVFHTDDPFAASGRGRKGRANRHAIADEIEARRHEVAVQDPWMTEDPHGATATARLVTALPTFTPGPSSLDGATGATPAAGWYPEDPSSPGALRYWDGSAWTDHRAVSAP